MTATALPPDDPPPVTIVMATRNGALHLPQQLQSLAAQTHANWSLFVSDDGSADDTRAILHAFADRHPVTLVDGPRRGAAANFLSALCHPRLPAGHVALADQDDVWLAGKLARGLRRLAAAPGDGPALYAAESILTDEGLRPLRASSAGRGRPGFAPSLCQNLFGGHTMMLNPAALDLVRRAGMAPGIAYHDWWIYQLIAGAGGCLILDAQPMAQYRQHGGNVLGGAAGIASALRRLGLALNGTWGAQMQAQAHALSRCADLLTPEARRTLEDFLSAPGAGPARMAAFRRLGLRRSSRAGSALMLVAAGFGLL
jgi:hypothetical protein